ncbi:MAG: amidohydrolase [Candidatus Hodarchaeales archaeon]
MDADIAIKNGTIITMDNNARIIENGFLLIKDKKILALGPMEEFPEGTYNEILNAGNHLVLPGFVNTHTHLPMVILRGIAEDLVLHKWLELIWKYEAKLGADDFYLGTIIACLESIRSGVTCVHDMYLDEFPIAKACIDTGMRAVLSYGMIDLFADDNAKKRESELAITKKLLNTYPKENELITISIAPHAPYTNTAEMLLASRDLAIEYNVPIHIHLAETKKEFDDFKKEHNKTPVQYLESLGFFDNVNVITAHSIWLSEEDIEILKNRGVRVTHNPASNMKLGSGIAKISEMQKAGILIGLGTDGAASNNNLSMLSDMRLMAFLQKVSHLDPEVLTSYDVVRMATIDGAKILGLGNKIGSLEEGKYADIVVYDLNDVNITPASNYYSTIVYSLKEYNIDHVILNGKILYKNKSFINPSKVESYIKSFQDFIRDLPKRLES